MIMRQAYQVDPGQIMEVDGWVGLTGSRDPGSEMDVVSRVEEVLYGMFRTCIAFVSQKKTKKR